MKRSFTRIGALTLGFVALCTFIMTGQQINRLVVNSPASIAGEYSVGPAEFGMGYETDLCGNTVLADDMDDSDFDPTNPDPGSVTDACTSPVSNATGNIVFVDRGDCQFGTKAINAENSGALAVVICNDEETGIINMPPGDDGGAVTIPVFSMAKADCDVIRVEFGGTVDACLSFVCGVPNYGPSAYWGHNPGEGDFANGMGDWTTDNPDAWKYSATQTVTGGSFGDIFADGPTSCNGFMHHYGDQLDSDGTGQLGVGICPGVCKARLISPTIDLTAGSGDGWSIQWNQAVRDFTSAYRILLSKNGGVSFPDTVEINNNLYVNDFALSENRVRVPLPESYNDALSLTFAFEIDQEPTGQPYTYYFWTIDDVVLFDGAYTDMQVNQNFWAVAPNFSTPIDQVAEMPFLADIANIGNSSATGVNLNMSIFDLNDTSAPIWSSDNNYADMSGGETVENQVFQDTYTPTAVGSYAGVYTVTSNEDDPGDDNNGFTFGFEINDNGRFQKYPQGFVDFMGFAFNNLTYWSDQPYYSAGNSFFVPAGEGKEIKEVLFGINNAPGTVAPGTIEVDVYEYLEIDFDPTVGLEISPTERQLVGTTSIIADTAADLRNIRAVPIVPGTNDTKVPLKNNTNYLIMINTNPVLATSAQIEIMGEDTRSLNNFIRENYRGATDLAMEELGINRQTGSWSERGADGTDVADRAFFSVANFSTVYTDFIIGNIVSNTDNLNRDLNVTFFPNPVQDVMIMNIGLNEVSERVLVQMTNVDGKLVKSQTYQNVIADKLTMNVKDVPSGTYFVKVTTDQGFSTKKVVVQK